MAQRFKNRGTPRPASVLPVLILASAALVVFWGFYTLDHYLTGGPPDPDPSGPIDRYVHFDPQSITDAVSSLAGMIAAVFGIVITVVSIIVQLSADRYTGVARMFLRDRTNQAVLAFYIVACVSGVWLSVSVHHDYVPRAALIMMMIATTGGLVAMAPYFGYVFWFLEPMNIVSRIRSQAVVNVERGAGDAQKCHQAQASTIVAMEELTDITSNSISGKDKIIASGAVDALKDFTLAYLELKPRVADAWFEIGPGIEDNPDFVAMDPESLQDLVKRRTWVEWKVMRQYLGIYNEALAAMRDIDYLIAIDTRYIGEAAAKAKDDELVKLVYRFMNSYLRATLNARDVRTAYNVLNQYRLLTQSMLREGYYETACEAVGFMSYYGHTSFDMNLTFVTETIAYDMAALCEHAHELGVPDEPRMLRLFLDLDQPLRMRSQEKALLGVRKAQAKLASYYLARGEEETARIISRDMEAEPAERLLSIRRSLESVTSKDFWEITDRGRNFEYMPPEQRAYLATFFEWLNVRRTTDPEARAEAAAPGE